MLRAGQIWTDEPGSSLGALTPCDATVGVPTVGPVDGPDHPPGLDLDLVAFDACLDEIEIGARWSSDIPPLAVEHLTVRSDEDPRRRTEQDALTIDVLGVVRQPQEISTLEEDHEHAFGCRVDDPVGEEPLHACDGDPLLVGGAARRA